MPPMSDTRTNEEWLYALEANGEIQETAITDLRDLLMRATLYFFNRNLSDFAGMNRDEILKCAEDCAQEALIAVMNHLSDFRGDSKFTTWVYKFAINMALMTARRERWKGKSLDQLPFSSPGMSSPWAMADTSASPAPDQSALQGEISHILRELIEQDLTEKQRQVLMLIVFHEVPMDEIVQQLGTNRNAIYKMLHDARRKLKSSLQARGFEVSELLTLFHESR
jgi:RNA polymerase sigma-70 factor, ECF subfamily